MIIIIKKSRINVTFIMKTGSVPHQQPPSLENKDNKFGSKELFLEEMQ